MRPASSQTISRDRGAPRSWDDEHDVYEVRPSIAYASGTAEPARSTRWRFDA
jgi:hypothetical protein